MAARTGDSVVVVFDGAPQPVAAAPAGRIQIVFSRPPETADDVLLRLARQHREGAIVVSSDWVVCDGARRSGATALTAEDFLGALVPAPDQRGDVDDDVDADEDTPAPRHGNPRRPSRAQRQRARALRRLRGAGGER